MHSPPYPHLWPAPASLAGLGLGPTQYARESQGESYWSSKEARRSLSCRLGMGLAGTSSLAVLLAGPSTHHRTNEVFLSTAEDAGHPDWIIPSSLGCLGDIQHFKEALAQRWWSFFGGMILQEARVCVTNCMGGPWLCDIFTAFTRGLTVPLIPVVSVEQHNALSPPQLQTLTLLTYCAQENGERSLNVQCFHTSLPGWARRPSLRGQTETQPWSSLQTKWLRNKTESWELQKFSKKGLLGRSLNFTDLSLELGHRVSVPGLKSQLEKRGSLHLTCSSPADWAYISRLTSLHYAVKGEIRCSLLLWYFTLNPWNTML